MFIGELILTVMIFILIAITIMFALTGILMKFSKWQNYLMSCVWFAMFFLTCLNEENIQIYFFIPLVILSFLGALIRAICGALVENKKYQSP